MGVEIDCVNSDAIVWDLNAKRDYLQIPRERKKP